MTAPHSEPRMRSTLKKTSLQFFYQFSLPFLSQLMGMRTTLAYLKKTTTHKVLQRPTRSRTKPNYAQASSLGLVYKPKMRPLK